MKRNIIMAGLLAANLFTLWLNFQIDYRVDMFMQAVVHSLKHSETDLDTIIADYAEMKARLTRLERSTSEAEGGSGHVDR
jgi:hypothetical protein